MRPCERKLKKGGNFEKFDSGIISQLHIDIFLCSYERCASQPGWHGSQF